MEKARIKTGWATGPETRSSNTALANSADYHGWSLCISPPLLLPPAWPAASAAQRTQRRAAVQRGEGAGDGAQQRAQPALGAGAAAVEERRLHRLHAVGTGGQKVTASCEARERVP